MKKRLTVLCLAAAALAVPAAASAQEVAFQSDRDGDDDIWVVPASGGKPRVLTRNRFPDATPAYSPDGKRIVYAAAPDGRQWDLYELPADGGTPTQLTFTDDASEFDPDYAPDESKIVFETVTGDDSDIAYVDVGGDGTPIALAAGPDFAQDPSFAPDSDGVAYGSRTEGDSDVDEARTSTPGDTTPLVSGSTVDADPAYSDDGQLAFTRETPSSSGIYVMDQSGGDPQPVTRTKGDDYGARWTGGGALEFSRAATATSRYGIFRIDPKAGAGGTAPRRIAAAAGANDSEPAERPAGGSFARARISLAAGCPTTTAGTFNGTNAADCRHGGSGKTTMFGNAGDDTLYGGKGNDSLYGNTGRDKLRGEAGADDLYARADHQVDDANGGTGADEAWLDPSDAWAAIEAFH